MEPDRPGKGKEGWVHRRNWEKIQDDGTSESVVRSLPSHAAVDQCDMDTA